MHPKAPTPPAVMASAPWEGSLPDRLRAELGSAITDLGTYLGQNFLVVDRLALLESLRFLKEREAFEYLVDVTAVDWPGRPQRFELVYILYSFQANERIRVKTHLGEAEHAPSVVSIYPTANWLEREVFDMFGIVFDGHGDLRRILLPDEWNGHPLRKDYGLLQMDNDWVKENLGIESGQ